MKLIIVRHGQTEANFADIIQGQLQGKLNKSGKIQAQKIGRYLKDEKINIAYVSDLDRTKETAKEILHFHPKMPVIFTNELRERHVGIYQGMKKDKKDMIVKEKGMNWFSMRPEGGESHIDAQKRIIYFYKKLLDKHINETILIVSHGSIVATFLCYLFDKPFNEETYNNYHPPNASITILSVDNNKKHAVHLLNSVEHLG